MQLCPQWSDFVPQSLVFSLFTVFGALGMWSMATPFWYSGAAGGIFWRAIRFRCQTRWWLWTFAGIICCHAVSIPTFASPVTKNVSGIYHHKSEPKLTSWIWRLPVAWICTGMQKTKNAKDNQQHCSLRKAHSWRNQKIGIPNWKETVFRIFLPQRKGNKIQATHLDAIQCSSDLSYLNLPQYRIAKTIRQDHCRFEARQDKEQETNMLLVEVGANVGASSGVNIYRQMFTPVQAWWANFM